MEYPEIYGWRTSEKHMFDPPEHRARVEKWFKDGKPPMEKERWRRLPLDSYKRKK